MKEKKRCAIILDKLKAEYPNAGTMLQFSNIFELLIAVVLSAQSTDEQVNKVTAQLFKKYNTPEQLADIELPLLEELIKGAGLYRMKAASIKNLSAMIRDEYDGQVPSDFNELLKLPGVGRKTANVMLAVGFNKPGLGVDTHVHRVANRLGLVESKTAEQTETGLKQLIPVEDWSQAHHLLIFHGRKICRSRKPECHSCVVEELCRKKF
ncbi:MAG: endonuclease III [Syntrophomonas sp.]